MIFTVDVENWWRTGQDSFETFRDHDTWVLRDVKNETIMGEFDTQLESKTFAYEMVHNILEPEARAKAFAEPTSFEVRQLMVKLEIELARKLGHPEIQNNKRRLDTMGMMFLMVKDALDGEVF